jgi:TPR repeat protein
MDTGQIDEAFHLLEFGYRHNPDRWELPYYLAFLHLFYRGDAATALSYLKEAMVKPDAPPFVESLSLALSHRLNKTELVVDYLRGLYSSTNDPDVRQRIVTVLQKLGTPNQTAVVAQ